MKGFSEKVALFLLLSSLLHTTAIHAFSFGRMSAPPPPTTPVNNPTSPSTSASTSNAGDTGSASTPTLPPVIVTGGFSEQIEKIASSSSCSQYNWQNRGRAPLGYIQGVALTFARSLCREKSLSALSSPGALMSEANTGNTSSDALAYYQADFSSLQISVSSAGDNTLRALYTLGLGLGMRESSGEYCTGWDTSAGSNRSSSQAEAGLFQTSYDSIGASPELQKLYTEYQANSSLCNLSVFEAGASCAKQSILGTGAGATFQSFNKSCPAFATEYAMILLRVLRSEFGPIIRQEAEVVPACDAMFDQVQSFVEQDLTDACKELAPT